MVNRLMDLVVLVAELSQKSDKSFRDLDKELIPLGYSAEEIEKAVAWMTSRPQVDPMEASLADDGYRILSPWESMGIDLEGYAYLLRLLRLGIADAEQFERIMGRILPYNGSQLELSEVKSLAGAVIFHPGVDEFEENPFQIFDDDTLFS